ncbi:transferrin receptor protein 1-like [Polymixia lowei]
MTMMDQIRAAFNNMFNSERYSRFAMHPEEEAGSHMEVKLSNEALDDTTEVTGQPGGSPSFRPKTRRNNCYWTSAVLLVIFAIGCLLGYACHRVPQPKPASCGAEKDEGTAKDEEPKSMELRPEPSLDWGDVTRLLSQKLTLQAFQETLSVTEVKCTNEPKRDARLDSSSTHPLSAAPG